MWKRRWVTRPSPAGSSRERGNRFSALPARGESGRSSNHSAPSAVSASTVGWPGRAMPSSEQDSGKLPRKCEVSTTTPRGTPGSPSRTVHQSWPGSRRRRVSQPSIHLPTPVYSPSFQTASPALRRFSLGAKNSSFAASTAPPILSDARSTRSVKSLPSVPEEEHALGIIGDPLSFIDDLSIQQGPSHGPVECPSRVRRELVSMKELLGVHHEARFRVPD